MFSISGIIGGAIGYVVFALVWVASVIASVEIALETYLTAVILQISNNIVKTIAVQSGFAVTLAITNLGFILGIIIIAIATILRRETYGIKKTLWKLVVAAILVNFSLVIGGVIINFANTFTNAFLASSRLPGSEGSNGPLAFATELAGAFSPQRALLSYDANNDDIGGTIASQKVEGSTGSALASIITPIVSAAFAVGLLVVIVITLAVFVFMLLIRYVTLSMLLILMPFAWLMWLFPKTSHLWTKWWSEFIRWTFFAPIVIFFLWLAIATARAMNSNVEGNGNPLAGSTYSATSANGVLGSLSSNFGSFIGAFAVTALQGCLIVGLAIGGMYVANKLSIMGAGAGLTAMKSVGNSVKGYAGRQSKKGARYVYQHGGGEKLNKTLMGSRIPFASTIGRGLQGVTQKGGKDLVKEASAKLKLGDMSDEDLVLAAKGARGNDYTLAVLEEAQKRNKLGILEGVGGEENLNAYLQKNERVFQDYGRKDLDKDINNAMGSNRQMRELAEFRATEGGKVMVRDTNGIMGPVNELVKAFELVEKSKEVAAITKEETDAGGGNTTLDHNGRKVKVRDLLNDAQSAERDANDAIDKRTGVKDERGVLGSPGQIVSARDLKDAVAKEFYAEKDKGDVGKMRPEAIFGGEAKFGLTKEALSELGGAITYALAAKKQTLVSPMAYKLDSADAIRNFFDKYRAGLEKAHARKEVDDDAYKNLDERFIKTLKRGLLLAYGSGTGVVPGARTQNASTPAPAAPPGP